MTSGWIMTLLLSAGRGVAGSAAPPPEAPAAAVAAAVAPAPQAPDTTWASPRAYERFLVGLVALERGEAALAVRALREARLLDPEAEPIRRCLAEAVRRAEAPGPPRVDAPGVSCALRTPPAEDPARLAPGDRAP